MNEKDEILEQGKESEEDLLDFEFDDLSGDDFQEGESEGTSDEEILELVDIVEKGEAAGASESDEIAQLLDEEEIFQEETTTEQGAESEFELDEVAEPAEDEGSGEIELDLDSSFEELETKEEEEEVFLDTGEMEKAAVVDEGAKEQAGEEEVSFEGFESEEKEGPELEFMEGELDTIIEGLETGTPAQPEPEFESPAEQAVGEEEPPEIPSEDFSGVPPAIEEESAMPVTGEGLAGLSEERLESIITRVVEDVVERVARETMTTVAERVITEAIDSLRESLDVPSE